MNCTCTCLPHGQSATRRFARKLTSPPKQQDTTRGSSWIARSRFSGKPWSPFSKIVDDRLASKQGKLTSCFCYSTLCIHGKNAGNAGAHSGSGLTFPVSNPTWKQCVDCNSTACLDLRIKWPAQTCRKKIKRVQPWPLSSVDDSDVYVSGSSSCK